MKLPRFSERVKDRALVVAVATLAALVAVCLVATLWIVSAHNGEIAALRAQAQTDTRILRTLQTDIKAQAKGNATVSQILVEAGEAVKDLESQEAAIEQKLGISP
jgi:septal ring factor EnvC (AmiA/AmiB activator)